MEGREDLYKNKVTLAIRKLERERLQNYYVERL